MRSEAGRERFELVQSDVDFGRQGEAPGHNCRYREGGRRRLPVEIVTPRRREEKEYQTACKQPIPFHFSSSPERSYPATSAIAGGVVSARAVSLTSRTS